MRRIEASRRNASACKGAFDDPTAWKHHESFRPIGALDDFSFELRQDLRQGLLKVRPLVATIGKELFQERVHPENMAEATWRKVLDIADKMLVQTFHAPLSTLLAGTASGGSWINRAVHTS